MDVLAVNCHTKTLIYDDIDTYSEKLNLHKIFVENNNSRNMYYCITWYFESNNIKEYFIEFINNIIIMFNKNNIVELISTVEKSKNYHIHVAIMFKSPISIYSKLNKLYKDINIEVIKCSDFENVKLYCFKDYTKIKTITPILININNYLQPIDNTTEKQNIEKHIVKVTQKVLERKIKNTIIKQAEEYEYVSNKHGVDYKLNELKNDILKLKKGEMPNFMNENVIGKRSPAFQKIIDDFQETIDILKDRLKFAKSENEELSKENYDYNIIIQNFTNSSRNTYGKNDMQNLNELSEKYNSLKDEYSKLSKNTDILKDEYSKLSQNTDILKDEYSKLSQNTDILKDEYSKLSQNTDKNNSDYYINIINSLQNINNTNLSTIENTNTMIKSLQEINLLHLTTINSLQTQHILDSEYLKTQNEKTNISYEQQIHLLKLEILDLQCKLKPIIDN